MLIRSYHVAAAAVGAQLGWINIVAALIGAALAWTLVSAAVRRWGVVGKLKIAPLLPLAALPAAFAVFAPWPHLAMVLMAVMILVMPMFGAALLSATSDLAPPKARGIFVSLYAFAVTMIGGTIGPFLVALATEHLFKRPDAVGYSITVVVGPALLLSALLLHLAHKALRREVALGGEMAQSIAAQDLT
jgi:MFS family permease